jgi:carbon storage regulator
MQLCSLFHKDHSQACDSWRSVAEVGKTSGERDVEDAAMLVLSRKTGEKIYIGDNICITVVDIDRGKIRLGIEAPRDVPIYRHELLTAAQIQELTKQQNTQAAS